jgi:hypothetical protein
VPSTIKLREFVDLLRIALISSWAGELYQALALSMLSNEIMTNRLGGVPSSATIFSVTAPFFPPNAAVAAAVLGSSVLKRSALLISLISMME